MVDIPIHNKNIADTVPALRIPGANGHIVEDAEPHSPVSPGMMTRRPDSAKCCINLPPDDRIDCGDNTSCRQRRNIVRGRTYTCVTGG